MVAHLVGAAEGHASVAELVRQLRAASRFAKRHGGPQVDGLSAVQVARHEGETGPDLADAFAAVWPRALRSRSRLPALVRRVARFEVEVPGIAERWSLGYLSDCIYTRDAWMHRVDLCRATGREHVVDGGHDGRIVADIAAEWARRHGQPVSLELTGPAGGTFTAGGGGPVLELDAVEFCRTLSRRAAGTGLLEQAAPF
jgi:hypothetical protein